MEFTSDTEALTAKRSELVANIAEILSADDTTLAERIVDAFCSLTPPQQPPVLMTYTVLRSGGYQGGYSRKPGNLWLNWKSLIRSLGDVVLTVGGAVATPWLIPFAALSLWNTVWTNAKVDLSREQAAALCAMWYRADEENNISRSMALQETNALFTVYKWSLLNIHGFNHLLRELEDLDCVEVNDDSVWLREWVKTSYE